MDKLKGIITQHGLFILLFLICLVLRLIPLFDYQFTYDELANLDWARAASFSELVETYIKNDLHPVLNQTIIFLIEKNFGHPEWLIKLPFLVFSFGAIVYAYLLCLRHFSKQVALLSTAFLSFSLIFVFYAPIARMYISGTFFSMALLYYFFEIVFSHSKKFHHYFLFGFFALLCALNQHLNALFAFTVFVSGTFLLDKSNYKNYLIAGVCIALAYLPHLPITLQQLGMKGMGAEQDGWLDKPYPDAFFTFIKILLGTGKTYLLVCALIVVSFILNRNIRFQKKQILLLALFIINYLVIYLYSVYRAPIFQNSVMLFSGVALLLFTCSLIGFKNRFVFSLAFTVLIAALIYKSYFKKDYYHQVVKTVFDYQFGSTGYYKHSLGEENVYPVLFDVDNGMKELYFKKYKLNFDYGSSTDSLTLSPLKFALFIKGLKCNHLAMASSTPLYQALVKHHFPYLVENTQTQGIHYKVYAKQKPANTVNEDAVTNASDVYNWRSYNYPKLKVIPKPGFFSLPADSTNEFPFDAMAKYSDVIAHEGEMVLVTAKLKAKQELKKLELCVSVNDDSSNVSYNYTAKPARDFVMDADSMLTVYCQMYVGRNHRAICNKSRLGCYLWNKGHERFDVKDFSVQVIDHWPWKWQYWE